MVYKVTSQHIIVAYGKTGNDFPPISTFIEPSDLMISNHVVWNFQLRSILNIKLSTLFYQNCTIYNMKMQLCRSYGPAMILTRRPTLPMNVS